MLSEFLNSKFLLLSRQTDNMGWGGVIHSFPSAQFCCCCFFCISVAPHPCCLFYCCHSPGHQAHLFSAPPLHTKRPVHITAQRHRRLLKLPTLSTDGDQDPSSCTAFLPSAWGLPRALTITSVGTIKTSSVSSEVQYAYSPQHWACDILKLLPVLQFFLCKCRQTQKT